MSKCKYWQFEKLNGYRPMTFYYTDFSVSEEISADAVQDKFDFCFNMPCSLKIDTLKIHSIARKSGVFFPNIKASVIQSLD